jgi:hypothetical protein
VLHSNEREFVTGLVAPSFAIAGAKVPAVITEEPGEAFVERMHLVEQLFGVLDDLYRTFLVDRLGEGWKAGWEPAIAAWAEGQSPSGEVLQRLQPAKKGKRSG